METRPTIPPTKLAAVAPLVLVVAAVMGLGIFTLLQSLTGPGSAHLSECGFDEHGPYAKVRVSSFLGGLGSIDQAQVGVAFLYDGAWYGVDGSYVTVKLPVLGSTTVVVPGEYPPKVIPPRWSGRKAKIIVEGHPVYRVSDRVAVREGHWPDTLLTRRQLKLIERPTHRHPHGVIVRGAQEERVPYDKSRITCSVGPLQTDE